MNRVVMPLFDFVNSDGQAFDFGDGRYALRKFRPAADMPSDVLGLPIMDLENLKQQEWALVAEDPDLAVFKADINRLLLSFKIHTLGRLFIKYRLCATNATLCSMINQRMTYVLAEKSSRIVNLGQLEEVNAGFERLQEMDAINGVSIALTMPFSLCTVPIFQLAMLQSFLFYYLRSLKRCFQKKVVAAAL